MFNLEKVIKRWRKSALFGNYFKIALRNVRRRKGYSFINISGLAIGMSCCILSFLFVRHEWSYDNFHANRDSIYRLVIQETSPDGSISYRRLIPPAVPPELIKVFPNVERYVQLVSGSVTINHQEQPFRERIFEADPTFFELFSFPLLIGDPKAVLANPNAMVISEDIAQKYFGSSTSEDYTYVLGQILSIQMRDGLRDFAISGVMKNFPDNSSLQIDILISFKNYTILQLGSNDWGGRTSTYLQLTAGQDPVSFEEKLKSFTATQFKSRILGRRIGGYIAESEDAFLLKLQPLRDVHLNPAVGPAYEQPTHNPVYSFMLSGIAFLVLLIACINFTTLSVGRSASRAREVGMRKVIGARRWQLALILDGAYLSWLLCWPWSLRCWQLVSKLSRQA